MHKCAFQAFMPHARGIIASPGCGCANEAAKIVSIESQTHASTHAGADCGPVEVDTAILYLELKLTRNDAAAADRVLKSVARACRDCIRIGPVETDQAQIPNLFFELKLRKCTGMVHPLHVHSSDVHAHTAKSQRTRVACL